MKSCAVEGCDRKHHSKGYCGMHRRRIERRGTTAEPPPRVAHNKGHRTVAACQECGTVRRIYGNGVCQRCYRRLQMYRLRRERAAREGREMQPVNQTLAERRARPRTCITCEATGGADDFYWVKHHNGKLYPSPECKACSKKRLAAFGKQWVKTEQGRRYRNEKKRHRLHVLAPPGPRSYEYSAVLRRDPCSYCGSTAGEIDHIDAVAEGGDGEWPNLTAACRHCNNAKKTKSLLPAMLEMAA